MEEDESQKQEEEDNNSPSPGDEEEMVSADPDSTPSAVAAPAAAADDNEEEDDVAAAGEDEEAQEAQAEDDGKKKNNSKKRKQDEAATAAKKPKKRNTNVWSKSTTRKSGKKGNSKAAAAKAAAAAAAAVDSDINSVYLTPMVSKVEDSPDAPVLLSKLQKAEKVELSADQLSASSVKGYRMVRATRGVVEGPWYFEVKIEFLGKTGHTRIGWCSQKGDVQAPVGYDAHGYAYRDLEGSKYHAALREAYGESYVEGDTIGVYINLPNAAELAPKPPEIVTYKGAPYTADAKEEEPLKPVPGSEIAFFRNGVCQGCAFKDVYAERYYPAASMYTLPNEPPCTVRFNFGPDFAFPPSDWMGLTAPQPVSSAPFADGQVMDALALSAAAAGSAAAPRFSPMASSNSTPKQQPEAEELERIVPRSVKSTGNKASKPPKPAAKKKKANSSPGLQLAVEVPIESSDAIMSQTDEIRRIASLSCE